MKVVIDNREITVKGHKTILEAARENNIYIPSLCDHPRLKPFSGCRLCLVEIKGRKGFVPSCSTFVEDGIEVKTKTAKIRKLRRQILELILSEHPNACLVCTEKDQCDEYKSTIRKVGEVTGCVLCSNNNRCELQDVVQAVGLKESSFASLYRNHEVRRDDLFFDRNYNLCILCGRCVRICHELRGASAISFVFRGMEAVVGTVLDRKLLESGCQFCGACVDVCPTGALAERAVKHENLPDKTVTTVCPLCSIGCELKVELHKGRILCSRPDESGQVNRGQACVKGRFLLRDIVYSPKRILKPLIRLKKELEEVSWDEALSFVAQKLKQYRGEEIALVSCPQSSNEEIYLFEQFARNVIKTKNIVSTAGIFPDYWDWARKKNLLSPSYFRIDDISQAQTLFLMNDDLSLSHPIVGLEVIQAVQNGAELFVASPRQTGLSRFSSFWFNLNPGTYLYLLLFMAKLFIEMEQDESFLKTQGFARFRRTLDKLSFSELSKITGISEENVHRIVLSLMERKNTAFLFGSGLTQLPWGEENLAALWNLALLCGAQLFPLGVENNLRGAVEIRRRMRPKARNIQDVFKSVQEGTIKALYCTGSFPPFGKRKPEFLLFQGSFMDENMERADAVFPAATFAESEGTYTNFEGRVQKFQEVVPPRGESKPDWWIITQVARKMGSRKFDYTKPSEMMEKIREKIHAFSDCSFAHPGKKVQAFLSEETSTGVKKFVPVAAPQSLPRRTGSFPFLMLVLPSHDYYRNLDLSQEMKGLKKMRDSSWVRINPEDARGLRIREGGEVELESEARKVRGIVKLDNGLPGGVIAAHIPWNNSFQAIPVKIRGRKKAKRMEK